MASASENHAKDAPPSVIAKNRQTIRSRILGCLSLRMVSTGNAQKVFEEVLAMAGEDRFGMELDAVDRIFLMAHAHDFALRRMGVDEERLGHGGRIDDERVVAGRLER